MKLKFCFFLMIVIVSICNCNKVDDLLTFTISNQASITIPSSSPITLPFEILLPDISSNSSREFENNNTRTDLIKDVKLVELNLSITSPADKTFSFLKSIHIYISTDGSDEIELAYLDDISSVADSIALITTNAKLDKYIKSSIYKLKTETVIRETVTENIEILIDLKFKVTADPL